MQRAIRKYVKKESEKIESNMGEDKINRAFDVIDSAIDKAKKSEVNRSRRRKLGEWKQLESINCRHGNRKKRLKGRSRDGRQKRGV